MTQQTKHRRQAVMVNDPEYKDHPVFSDLDQYIAFYNCLSGSVFSWVTPGTQSLGNIDSYLFSSIQGTLTSIRTILRDGRINDAYSLLRKYYDSAIINIYSNLYLDQHFGIDNLVVEQISNWLNGTTRLPEYRIMSQYIRSSPAVDSLTSVLFADDHYYQIRNRCNDHTHYNFYGNVLLNDNQILLSTRGPALKGFAKDLRDVFILHVAYVFLVRQNYMMSSDYVDFLDCGTTPEENSQYWVAPFVQEVFDEHLAKHRPDVAAVIKAQTSMYLA